MTCWVCQGTSAFTDEHNLDWCAEHIAILKKAWEETADDNSL